MDRPLRWNDGLPTFVHGPLFWVNWSYAYVLNWVPMPGLDMTPLAFSITGACFIASVFSARR